MCIIYQSHTWRERSNAWRERKNFAPTRVRIRKINSFIYSAKYTLTGINS